METLSQGFSPPTCGDRIAENVVLNMARRDMRHVGAMLAGLRSLSTAPGT
jgi:hypothetical protein